VLFAGIAAQSVAKEAPSPRSAGALLPSAAAAVASPSFQDVRPSSRAHKPNYVTGGWQCPPGYAWRNAGTTDWLCVDPQEARRIAYENQTAATSWGEAGDGTPACRPGLVRRNAFKKDIVCVAPDRREAVQQMNYALFSIR
jgi:hypothetical protein